MLSGGWRYRSPRALPSEEEPSLLIPVRGKGQLSTRGGRTPGGPWGRGPLPKERHTVGRSKTRKGAGDAQNGAHRLALPSGFPFCLVPSFLSFPPGKKGRGTRSWACPGPGGAAGAQEAAPTEPVGEAETGLRLAPLTFTLISGKN